MIVTKGRLLLLLVSGFGAIFFMAGVYFDSHVLLSFGLASWLTAIGAISLGLRRRTTEIIVSLKKIQKSAERGSEIALKLESIDKTLQHLQRFILDQQSATISGFRKLGLSVEGQAKETEQKLSRHKIDIVQEVESIHQLRELVDPVSVMPLLGGWAMDPVAMRGLVDLVLKRKPRLIVEFGGGTSTLWLAYALKKLGSGKVITFEHMAELAEQYKSTLDQHNLLEFVDVRHAPLEETTIEGRGALWYAKSEMRDLLELEDSGQKIDMLIVDGPPGKGSNLARYPAFPLLKERLSDDALVVVDDATRRDERLIVRYWRSSDECLSEPYKLGRRTQVMEFQRETATV